MKTTKAANLFFLVFILFLFLQFGFIMSVAEPYPAIVFPGFGDVPDKHGTMNFSEAQLWAYRSNGDSAKVEIGRDFSAIPRTYQTMMMRELTQYVKDNHAKKASFQVGNYRINGSVSRVVGPQKKKEFAQWVASNAGWAPSELAKVEVHWYDHELNLQTRDEQVDVKRYSVL